MPWRLGPLLIDCRERKERLWHLRVMWRGALFAQSQDNAKMQTAPGRREAAMAKRDTHELSSAAGAIWL